MHSTTRSLLTLLSGAALVAADLTALDISSAQSSSFWTCAASNYDKVVIRGYQQACGEGGAVDSNFVASYNAAANAGVSYIDAYMFPCTGTQPTGVSCKSPTDQLNELINTISDNDMNLEYLWFDIEPTSGTCNAWNLGADDNESLANEWITALQNTGLNWGVYANGNQWSGIFPSRDTDIASSLPLWAVQDDYESGVGTVDTFMGGWTSAYAKQYYLDTTACGGSVDLDSFSG
ncbi:MAG: hypothetical protein M1819_006286 [Sarea resinae]|nr:MAG: hypothetical protein M1819_006286 [Sarea resinae]